MIRTLTLERVARRDKRLVVRRAGLDSVAKLFRLETCLGRTAKELGR